MERKFRLTRTTDFLRVRRTGKSYAHPLVVLIVMRQEVASVRVGITASHAVGKAVERNRAKRRIRACMSQEIRNIQPGWDIVLVARQPITQASFEDLCAAIHQLLKRAGVLLERVHEP